MKGLGADKGDLAYNNAIPLLMRDLLPNGVLGVAVTGLLASFMAGMAANVSGFNTVFTYDIWQAYVRRRTGSDEYYLRIGRMRHGRRPWSSASAPRSSRPGSATS